MSEITLQSLRSLVNERLAAAAEEILGVFERTVVNYEEEVFHCKKEINRQRTLLDTVLLPETRLQRLAARLARNKARTSTTGLDSLLPHLLACEEEVHPEQRERSPGLLQGLEEADIVELTFNPVSVKCSNDGEKPPSSQLRQTQDPEPLQIKEEREELFQHLEEADGSKMTLHPVTYDSYGEITLSPQTQHPELLQIKDELLQGLEGADGSKITVHPVKRGDGQENARPFQPLQTQREKNREAYSLPSTSTEQMKTEPDAEDCGVSEPASNLYPAGDLETTRDGQLLSSDCSLTETDDMVDYWKPQSGLKTPNRQSLSNSRTLNRSMESSHELTSSSHTQSAPSCKVCGLSFLDTVSLMMHIQVNSSDCGLLCGNTLDPTESLNLHLEAHRTSAVCGKGFTKNIDIARHMRSHNGEKSFICSDCGRAFGSEKRLQTHMKSHTGQKPIVCLVCGKAFSCKAYLQIHTRIHTGEKPFRCSVCGKGFYEKGDLTRHMRSHTGEKPFSCSLCGKRFTQIGNLGRHMKSHTGEKPFGCLVCGKGFREKGHLKKHMTIHTGEKFGCSVCGKTFTREETVRVHMRSHTGEKPFSSSS